MASEGHGLEGHCTLLRLSAFGCGLSVWTPALAMIKRVTNAHQIDSLRLLLAVRPLNLDVGVITHRVGAKRGI